MLYSLLVSLSLATPLRVDNQHIPTQTNDGYWSFERGYKLKVLPSVVISMRPGFSPPSGSQSLGGKSWLLHVDSPNEAIVTAIALQADNTIQSAWPDVVLPRQRYDMFDDPNYPGQWYLQALEMAELYEYSLGDPAIRVAVIDSGIDIAHPDLADGVVDPYDAWADDADPSPNPGEFCYGSSETDICDEHGTAVSGIIAARANNATGIVGLCPACSLVPIKLLGDGLQGAMSSDIAAFEHAISANVGVINNSWGYTTSIPAPQPLADVIHRAATEPRDGLGALVIFAAGNDDREIVDDELQALNDVLCVSATDSYGQPTAYTNFGSSVDVAAPSATVTIAPNNEVITNFGGTSGAAPVVSGLAAWALSVNPNLSAQELHTLLIETSTPSPLVTHDEDGHHEIYGFGELNPVSLYNALVDEAPDTGAIETKECGCQSAVRSRTSLGLISVVLMFIWRRR